MTRTTLDLACLVPLALPVLWTQEAPPPRYDPTVGDVGLLQVAAHLFNDPDDDGPAPHFRGDFDALFRIEVLARADDRIRFEARIVAAHVELVGAPGEDETERIAERMKGRRLEFTVTSAGRHVERALIPSAKPAAEKVDEYADEAVMNLGTALYFMTLPLPDARPEAGSTWRALYPLFAQDPPQGDASWPATWRLAATIGSADGTDLEYRLRATEGEHLAIESTKSVERLVPGRSGAERASVAIEVDLRALVDTSRILPVRNHVRLRLQSFVESDRDGRIERAPARTARMDFELEALPDDADERARPVEQEAPR